MGAPKRVLLLSGKRKSGKDFIAEKLSSILGDKVCILRISEPIKSLYAETHGLSLQELMSDGPLKETYRLSMALHGEQERAKDPGCFCRAACNSAPSKDVWIVSDVRRKTDMEWFKETYGDKIRTVRIQAKLEVRKARGWVFAEGIDDKDGECGLDDYPSWDLILNNDGDESLGVNLQSVVELIQCSGRTL